MSLQKSVFVYNLSNSVLRYCLWLAPSCHAGKEDALFYIPASGDISCSLRGNTGLAHYVCILLCFFEIRILCHNFGRRQMYSLSCFLLFPSMIGVPWLRSGFSSSAFTIVGYFSTVSWLWWRNGGIFIITVQLCQKFLILSLCFFHCSNVSFVQFANLFSRHTRTLCRWGFQNFTRVDSFVVRRYCLPLNVTDKIIADLSRWGVAK